MLVARVLPAIVMVLSLGGWPGLFGEMTKKTFFPTYQDRVKTVFEGPIWAYNIIQTVSNSMMITCKN
jgi:hypothetical protein